jgi:23S rRNA (cytosine1962-C5)-methyltransferase
MKPAPREPSSTPQGYELLDSGGFQKLERFGPVILARPCAQAIWRPRLPEARWRQATARFTREGQTMRWAGREALPKNWDIVVDGLAFRLSSTDFGHLGIFPEQRDQWRTIRDRCAAHAKAKGRPARILNLFAYSGGSTLAAAMAQAEVCHVDASKGMVEWARKNASLNRLEDAPIRWIVDDVTRFLEREARRARRYDFIILDPPSYGRGAKGEVFKIETDLPPLLEAAGALISDEAFGVLLTCHTPELTPLALSHLLRQELAEFGGTFDHGEMVLRGTGPTLPVPSGSFAMWEAQP